jgi:anti-sigma B factor antagonist
MSATQQPMPISEFRPFSVDVRPHRDVVRVCPSGEVDLATVATIQARVDELTAAGFRRLVLDLRGVTFLDSTGLRLVLELEASARAEGWHLTLVEGPPEVQRVFELAGLRAGLAFVDAVEADLRRWR